MRVALLSTLDRSTNSAGLRAPFRQFAGSRIIDRQIDLALAAGCEAIACLVDGIGREVVEAQRRAEQAGARFIAMQQSRGLSGLVSASDEVFVMSAGVLPAEDVVLRHLAHPVVLAFPADDAVPRGYERLDLEFAWSGVLLAPGSTIERLAAMPEDSDTISTLLRIALQSGVKIYPVEKRLLDEGQWHLDPSHEDLAERERQWIATHAAPAAYTAPGLAVAERIGSRLARDTLGTRGVRLPGIAAAICGAGALGLAAIGFAVPALGLGLVTAGLAAVGHTVDRIARAGQFAPRSAPLAKTIDWAIDPLLAVLVAAASPEDTGWLRLFVPVVLFALLRLGASLRRDRWKDTYDDRIAVTALLLPCAFFGFVQPAAAILALIALVSLFFAPRA